MPYQQSRNSKTARLNEEILDILSFVGYSNQMGPPTEAEYLKQQSGPTKTGGLTPEQGAEIGAAAVNITMQILPLLKSSESKKAFKEEMKQACGRKPWLFPGKRTDWFQCQYTYLKKKRDQLLAQQRAEAEARAKAEAEALNTSKKDDDSKIPTFVYVIGGVILAGGVIWGANKLIR